MASTRYGMQDEMLHLMLHMVLEDILCFSQGVDFEAAPCLSFPCSWLIIM